MSRRGFCPAQGWYNLQDRGYISEMKVYLNGNVSDEGEALIPAGDRGVLFGDGIFETVRAYSGKPFRMDRHLERLRTGGRDLRLSGLPVDGEIMRARAELYPLHAG